MAFTFKQLSPTVWEVWETLPDGHTVFTFDNCAFKRTILNPHITRLETYNTAGRITSFWRAAQKFRGKPDKILWQGAHVALMFRITGAKPPRKAVLVKVPTC